MPSLLPEVNTDADDPRAKYAAATTLAGIAHAAGTATSLTNLGAVKLTDIVNSMKTAAGTDTVTVQGMHDNKADNVNPKQEVLQLGYNAASGVATFEVSEPLLLSSWQHGYAVGPSDHQLMLTVSNTFTDDLLHCAGASYTAVKYGIPAKEDALVNTAYVNIKAVELHCAFVGPSTPFIPKSVSYKFSQYDIATRLLQSKTVNESIVVPPSTRLIYVSMRQRFNSITADREELGLAGVGISEIAGQVTRHFESFQAQLGSSMAPTPAYGELDPAAGMMARPFNDMLSVIGKPNAMRGSTLSYAEYCGFHNTNKACGVGAGDKGCVFMMRLLTPPNSLSNVLNIRGTLAGIAPTALAQQELVVTIVNDQLWNMEYAPPQEIPINTVVNPIV